MPVHGPQSEPGLFLETTSVYDIQSIYEMDVNTEQFKELIVRLRQSINDVALAVNAKDTGYYPKTEFVCGQAYFPNPLLTARTPQAPTLRQVFRKVFTLPAPGTLPAVAGVPINFAHNIPLTDTYTFTRIYGCSSNTVAHNYIPLPFIGAAGAVELSVIGANIHVETTANFSAYNNTYIILEYIKN